MAYQFTQTGQEIQDILNQVGTNTGDISSLDTRLTTAEGDISALNTSFANIGTRVYASNSSAVTVAISTYTALCSVTLPAGQWIIFGYARFSSSYTTAQFMRLGISFNSTGIPVSDGYEPLEIGAAVSGTQGFNCTASVSLDSAQTQHLVMYHTGGASVGASMAHIVAVRIA